MEINKFFTIINDDRNYYLIKTNNGKYCTLYLKEREVSLYPLTFSSNELDIPTNNKLARALNLFINLKLDDVVLIPSTRNKSVYIGQITSIHYMKDQHIYKKVKWIKEITTTELYRIHQYLHIEQPIICINGMKNEVGKLQLETPKFNHELHELMENESPY